VQIKNSLTNFRAQVFSCFFFRAQLKSSAQAHAKIPKSIETGQKIQKTQPELTLVAIRARIEETTNSTERQLKHTDIDDRQKIDRPTTKQHFGASAEKFNLSLLIDRSKRY